MKRFAFYVSGNATRVRKFLEIYKERLPYKVLFILIDGVASLKLKELCAHHDIVLYEEIIHKVKDKNRYISNTFLTFLEYHHIDYAFVFADKILVGEILHKYAQRLINFHPSILPSNKGLNAIDKALSNHDFLLGNSAHFITADVDCGMVIMQNIVPAIAYKTYDDVLDNQIPMLFQLMCWIEEERVEVISGKVVIKDATYQVESFIPNLEYIKDLDE
jgi:phosphoribosylglycinamide formyltransferase-1